MSQYSTLLYQVQDHIGTLTLNRPQKLNAIDDTMLEELGDFWHQRRHDTETRVIILQGAGEKGFCGGLDIKQAWPRVMAGDIPGFYVFQQRLSRLLLAMRQCPQPVIALIHGAAAGGGLSMALASDLRIISHDARFAAAYSGIGLGGADMSSSYFLPRLIGAGRAYEFLLTGDFIDAATAQSLGLVSRVVERDQLMPTGLGLAQTMCRKNPLGLRLTKEAINCSLEASGLEQVLNMEDRNQALCFATLRYEGASQNTR
jgi:enoyl-CoA hydratase/carnithine racemase